MDWELVAVGVVIALQLATIKILFEMVQGISTSIDVVGHSLKKINSMIEMTGLDGGVEPPSMVQQAVAQLIMSKMQAPQGDPGVLEVIRGEGGKFSKE